MISQGPWVTRPSMAYLCSLLQGLTRLQSTCQSELGSHLGLGVLFEVHVIVGRIHFLVAVELLTSYFFKASRGIAYLYTLLKGSPD